MDRYNALNPAIYLSHQEKERALIRWLKYAGLTPVDDKRVLEIGCGLGGNLLQLLRFGFRPENLVGNELSAERAQQARHLLPSATSILVGDAAKLDLAKNSFDVVFQSTVFSSLLDKEFQKSLARHIWALAKPGGGILWYDFTYDNPWNPEVRGIPVKQIKDLFPQGELKVWRLTLAPPINRLVTKIHPRLYGFFNALPFLRTHVLAWIKKIG